MSAAEHLARGRRELQAAQHLAAGGYASEAVSRAYYAAFHAAEAALIALGETRSKHSAVIAAFTEHLVKTGEIDPGISTTLRSLFDRRTEADYGAPSLPAPDANAALRDAEKVIRAIEQWIAKPG